LSAASGDRATPAEVGPTEDGAQLRIRWRDGHVSEYTPRLLRLSCPCAGCVEEMSGRPLLNPALRPAGRVSAGHRVRGAVRAAVRWSDGHKTGIYPFDMLRDLCRCLECLDPEGSGSSE
jgi:DUF971 family protein